MQIMRTVKRALLFADGELKRQFSDYKIYITMLCLIAVMFITMRDMPSLIRESGEKVGIFELFPLYWNGMNLPGAYFAVYLLLVCDIPSHGLGMRNHVMRAGRVAYFWGETIYTAALTTGYLILMWLVSMLPFPGHLTVTVNQWSSVVYNSRFGTSSFGLSSVDYITNGTPLERFWQCMVLVWLCCFLMGMVSVVVNMATGSIAGCVTCAGFLMIHIMVMNLLGNQRYPAWLYFCSPITATWAFMGKISSGIAETSVYYLFLIFGVMLAGRMIVRSADV